MDRRSRLAKEKAEANRKKVLEFLVSKLPNDVRAESIINALETEMKRPTIYTHLKKLVEMNLAIRKEKSPKEVYYKAAIGSVIELKIMNAINAANNLFFKPIKSKNQIYEEIRSSLNNKNNLKIYPDGMSITSPTKRQQEIIDAEIVLFNRQSKIISKCLRYFYEIYCELFNKESIKDVKNDTKILFIYPEKEGSYIEDIYIKYITLLNYKINKENNIEDINL